MANPEHLAVLRDAVTNKDIRVWNEWYSARRAEHSGFRGDLSGATLTNVRLLGINLAQADITKAILLRTDLREATLTNANFTESNLTTADLTSTRLNGANLFNFILTAANLNRANLTDANLAYAKILETNFLGANLTNTDFTNASVGFTQFDGVDLSSAKGLDRMVHRSPCYISIDSLYRAKGTLPEVFLRGCGVPDSMITFSKSLASKAIEYYSCFISYSSSDELFVRRLYNDLQANGVRVWFAPEDLKIGDPIKQSIDESILLYDKLIIVLSENAIKRAWVRHEVTRALEKEKRQNQLALFPIRLDNSVFETTEQWAFDIRERHIADFRRWKSHESYQSTFKRLLRDLNASSLSTLD